MTQVLLPEDLLRELESGWDRLNDKPDETPGNTLAALWPAAEGSEERLRELVRQRMAGVPLAHLTGRQQFMGMEMLAGPEALIPRKETEILCAGALRVVKQVVAEQGRARVLDLCCGSGNVGLALAALEPGCEVWLGDISGEAVELARRNARHLGLTERTHFAVSDLFAGFDSAEFHHSFDVITCNPPYISSAKVERMHPEIADHEPRLAFDGGPFGVKVITRLIREAPMYLKALGWLAFEVGLGQGAPIVKMLGNNAGYRGIETLSDERGDVRAVLACAAA